MQGGTVYVVSGSRSCVKCCVKVVLEPISTWQETVIDRMNLKRKVQTVDYL